MKASAVIAPTQLAYVSIPANELRDFVDGIFPKLATCPAADALATGQGHRYIAGHDLFLDVPQSVAHGGIVDGLKHAGHILLTDFPTKAGIPIPGFSESGLGHFLEQIGIHRGWLQVNICEAGLGVLAIAEGAPDLMQAIHGALPMDLGTFFDTFVEGGIETGIAICFDNPLMLAGGLENIAAGLVSTWNTIAVHVDPVVFFGSAVTSAILGFVVSSSVFHNSLGTAAIASIRSGVIGSLFAVSPAFGFGALAGFILYTLGKTLAKSHANETQALLSVDETSYRRLIQELCEGNLHLQEFIDLASPKLVYPESPALLATEHGVMRLRPSILRDDFPLLKNCYSSIFSDAASVFETDHISFSK